jgi:hypothetical protein
MSVQAEKAPRTTETQFEPAKVNVRIKISALWTAMLFVFIYVDHFSLLRPDTRADLEAGQVGGFTVNQPFLLFSVVYVLLPILMVVGTLVLRPRISRIANIALSIVYALSIVPLAIGEWYYYVLGSAVEVVLLAAIAFYAWTWPKVPASGPADRAEASADPLQHSAA